MKKPLNVYNLGEEGVNVDSDDVHVRDGELRAAQNFQVDPAGGLGGIRRRDGLNDLNTALAGAVTGIIALPLPDRSALTRTFYAPIDSEAANFFRKSTNGTTWANSTNGSVPASRDDFGTFGTGSQELYSGAMRWAGFNNRLYYPGSDYVAGTDLPTIHVWDGTTDYKFTEIPRNPNEAATIPRGVLSFVPYDENRLIVTTYDSTGGTGLGRVLLLNVNTGQWSQVGPETSLAGLPMNTAVWQGKIWTGLINLSGGSATTVRWARPEDATWTTDLTTPVTLGYVIDLAVFQGNLYIALAADVGDSAEIRKRTSDGTWSIVLTADGTGASNFLGPLIVNDDDTKIFAFWSSVSGGGAPTERISESSDGSS